MLQIADNSPLAEELHLKVVVRLYIQPLTYMLVYTLLNTGELSWSTFEAHLERQRDDCTEQSTMQAVLP